MRQSKTPAQVPLPLLRRPLTPLSGEEFLDVLNEGQTTEGGKRREAILTHLQASQPRKRKNHTILSCVLRLPTANLHLDFGTNQERKGRNFSLQTNLLSQDSASFKVLRAPYLRFSG
jgi:hypothetical protein